MPIPTPFPDPNGISSTVELIQYSNTVTNDLFGTMIILAIGIIAFMALGTFPKERAAAAASTLALVTSIMFRQISLVGDLAVIVSFVAMLVSFYVLWRSTETQR